MSLAIENRFQAVEKVINAASQNGLDEQMASYLCRLGSVLICGAVERSIEIIIDSRVCQRSVPQISSFMRSYFKKGTNYTSDQIATLLMRLDVSWGSEFERIIEANERFKTSLNSCYAIRNSVAHGGTQSLGPTILRQYFDDAFSLICEVEKIVR
jgi:RiboL-PSP-HEPN